MQITENTWIEYITRLAKINETAGQKMAEYIARHGTQDTDALIAYAQALVQKYGEGSCSSFRVRWQPPGISPNIRTACSPS